MTPANYWRRKDVDAVVDATAKTGPLERTASATERIAASSRSQLAIGLSGRDGEPGSWSAGVAGNVVAPEQVVRSLTRWQGSDTTSLVRALRASFEQTSVQGRSVLRYRGAGRVWSGASSTSSVGPGARALRRITPGLHDVIVLLDRLKPVDPGADAMAARSTATAVRDRLNSYAEELGRGYDSREGRLRAIRDALRGPNPAVLGGALGRLQNDLALPAGASTSEEEEALVDDFQVLVDYVFALDGTPSPIVPGGLGPTEWRDGVEDELAGLSDLLAELRNRLRVEGITHALLETRFVSVSGARQSVADVLGWVEELVARTAPQLLEAVARQDSQAAIEAELNELRQWFGQLVGIELFRSSPLLSEALADVRRGMQRLTIGLRRV